MLSITNTFIKRETSCRERYHGERDNMARYGGERDIMARYGDERDITAREIS